MGAGVVILCGTPVPEVPLGRIVLRDNVTYGALTSRTA